MKDLYENSGNRLKKTNTRYTLPSLLAFSCFRVVILPFAPLPRVSTSKERTTPNTRNVDSPPNEAKNSRLTFPHGQKK